MASEKVVDDPNFAIICAFLHKFAPICGIEHPDVQEIQTMLEDMEEVAPELMDLHIKLMRKTKYNVRPDKWERSLVKFSHSFSNVDAWELEQFGYKKLRIPVRLRILKALLETQFDSNMRFKTAVNGIAANELRPLPLGRDKEGNSYWSTLDQKCNLRIYQEHLDEETWRVVATSRDELVKLIAVLNGTEPIAPNLEGLVDEDSSSNSNGLLLKGEHVLVKQDSNSTSLSDDTLLLRKKPQESEAPAAPEEVEKKEKPKSPIKEEEKESSEESSEEEEEEKPREPPEKAPPQITKIEGHKNKYNKPSLVSSFAKKEPLRSMRSQRYSKRLAESCKEVEEEKLSIPDTVLKTPKVERLTLLGKSNLDKINKFKKMDSKKKPIVEDTSEEEDSDEEEEEEQEEEESEDEEEEFSEPIEEPVMIVKGSGSGKDCEAGNPVFECSETVEEETLYIFGEGSGADCDVGNTKDEEKSPTQSKPMFFFGQPGCLKLSPMKQTVECGFGQQPIDEEASDSSNPVNDKKENCENEKGESSKEDVESNKEDALSIENDINDQRDHQTNVEENAGEKEVGNRKESSKEEVEVKETPVAKSDKPVEVSEQELPKAEVSVAESPSEEVIVKESEEVTEPEQPKTETSSVESPSEKELVDPTKEVETQDHHAETSIAESPSEENIMIETKEESAEAVSEQVEPSVVECPLEEDIVKESPVTNVSPVEKEKSPEKEIVEQETTEKVEENPAREEEASHSGEAAGVEEPSLDDDAPMSATPVRKSSFGEEDVPMENVEKGPEISETIDTIEAEELPEEVNEIPEESANSPRQDIPKGEDVEPMEIEPVPVNPVVEDEPSTSEPLVENDTISEKPLPPEDPVLEASSEEKEVQKDMEMAEEEAPMEIDEPSSSIVLPKEESTQENISETPGEAQIPTIVKEVHNTPENIFYENKQTEESSTNEENLPDSAENNSSGNELLIDEESCGDQVKVFTEEVESQVVPEKVATPEPERKIETTDVQEKVQEDSSMESGSKEDFELLDSAALDKGKTEDTEPTKTNESASIEDKPSETQSAESPKTSEDVSVTENTGPEIEEIEQEVEKVLPEEKMAEKVDSPKVKQSVEDPAEENSLEKNLDKEEIPPEVENVCEKDPVSAEVLPEAEAEALQSENVEGEPLSNITDQIDEVSSEELKEPSTLEEDIQTEPQVDKQDKSTVPEESSSVLSSLEVPQETPLEEKCGLEIDKVESPKTPELQSHENAQEKQPPSQGEENQKLEVLEESTTAVEEEEKGRTPKSPEAAPVVSQIEVQPEKNLLNDTEEISDDEDGFEDPPLEICPEDKVSVPENTCVPMELEELSGSQIITDPDSSSAPESDKGDYHEEATTTNDTPMELEDDPGSSMASEPTDLSIVRAEEPPKKEDVEDMELEETEESPPLVIESKSTLEAVPKPQKIEVEIQEMPKEAPQEEKPAKVPVSKEAPKPEDVNRMEEESVDPLMPEDLSKSAPKESLEATPVSKDDDEDSLSSPEFEGAISPESEKSESPKPDQAESLSKADNNNEMKVSEKPHEKEAVQIPEVKTVVQAKTYFPECSAVESESLEESALAKKRRLSEHAISPEKESEGKRVKVESKNKELQIIETEKKKPEKMEVTQELEVPKKVETVKVEEKMKTVETVTKQIIEDKKEVISKKNVEIRKPTRKLQAEKKEATEKLPEKKTETLLNLSLDYEPPATIIRLGRKTRGRRPVEVEQVTVEVKPQKPVEEVKPRGRKPVEVKKAKVEEKEEDVEAQLEDLIPVSKIDKNQIVAEKEEAETKESTEKKPFSGRGRGRGRGGRRPQNISEDSDKKKATRRLGLDIDESAIIQEHDDQPVVRQSRRIAQLKIREEAERRKLEEIALQKMKEDAIRKKKQEHHDYVPSPESDSDDDYKKILEKKKRGAKKKSNPAKWHSGTGTSESEEEDGEEEEDGLEPEYVGSPLFKSDHEFSPESDLEDDGGVPMKLARTVRKDPEDDDFEENPEHACQKCGKHDHPEWILLCDGCDKGYHCSCLKPVLFVIPEGDWFCPPCQHTKLLENLNAKLDELDGMIEEKEKEELRQQRLTFNSVSAENIIKAEEAQKAKSPSRRSVKAKSSSSSDDNSSDNEPIYKLRKRRLANVSYRFNEYDALINSAIKDEIAVMEEGMSPFEDETRVTAGNLGRGKDISTIIEADKKEKMSQLEAQNATNEDHASDKSDSEAEPPAVKNDESSDSEPIRPSGRHKLAMKKKNRKLNTLDISSEDDGSDEDFQESSPDSEDSAESLSSGSENSMELELLRKKNRKAGITTRRSVRSRPKVYDEDFIDDNDSDEVEAPVKKKRKKEDSDFSDFDDSDEDEDEEDIDSDDLCDDSDSGSDSSDWRSRKKKAQARKPPRPTDKPSNTAKKQPKKKEDDEDTPFRASSKKKSNVKSDEEKEVTRRTRGKKINFLEDYYDDSSDDGIKPGVKRPDTPPEEREMFIKKQEEIKRMLAAKNTELAKEMATPKLEPLRVKLSQAPESPSPDAAPGVIPSDSISTVPLQVIQTAKALDVDLRPSAAPTASPSEDFNPEDMNEEELAKMMEDEAFAQQQLKLAGEAIRNKKLREAEMNRKAEAAAKEKLEAPLPTPPLAIPVYTPTHQEPNQMLPGQIRIPTAPLAASQSLHPLQHPVLRPTVPMPYPPVMHMQPPHLQMDPRGEMDPEHPSVKLTKAGLVPKKRGRKSKLELQAIADAKARADVPFYPGPPQGPPVSLPPSSHPLTSLPPSSHAITSQMANMERPSVLQAPNAVVTAAGEPVIPTTVLSVQGTPTPGVTDSKMELDSTKKRGRRKKITPLRDNIPGGQITTISGAMKGDTESTTSNPILAERLEAPPSTSEASKKVTSQLYPPGSSGGAILSRLQQQMRPLPGPFGAQGLPGSRYFPSSHHLGHSSLNMSLHHLRANFAGTPSSTAPGSINNGLGDRPPGLYVSPDQRGVPGPHGIFRGSGPMYPGHGYQGQQSLLHHQLQSLDPSLGIRGPPPQEYQSPYLPPQFGGFYAPPSQAAQPTATTASSVPATTSTPSATTEVSPATTSATATSTAAAAPPYSQFETLKSSSPHENASHSYSNSPAHVEAGSTSEFSGLVSYFSSQQDDLEP